MIEREALLEQCRETVRQALALGADQAEVYASSGVASEVELQKDDIHTAATEDETLFGIRVLRGGSLGFATVNGMTGLAPACRDALDIAAATPPDSFNRMLEPRPVIPLDRAPDKELAALDISTLVERAASMLDAVRARDSRVRIDSGGVGAGFEHRAIASSTGIELCDSSSYASANLFGMAVDGDDVGSFDYDAIHVLRAKELDSAIAHLEASYVEKCLGALGARPGETFRGTVILSPEVVRSFLLGDLLPVLSAKAVRTGRSPLAEKRDQPIAVPELTLIDDARHPDGTASSAFDREGMPTRRHVLVDRGRLCMFMYDGYESLRAGVEPTGHACGGAGSLPSIGASNLSIEPGEIPYAEMCASAPRAVLVNRFSGSSSPVTGEFSGVVKGGFMLRNGERIPIRETMIAGNLYELLRSISGISREVFNLQGSARLPAIRVEDVSITAG